MNAPRPLQRGRAGDPLAMHGTSQSQRRRLLLGAMLVPAGGLVLSLATRRAHAASPAPNLAPALSELDAAAMALFDAAEAGRWPQCQAALKRACTAAGATSELESRFTEAGGELDRFFEARNGLSGDLVEAGIALSAKDRRWLVSCADRIIMRAGELSQPFVRRAGTTDQRGEVLLFLARRMRRALVWSDDMGYRSALEDFRSLWQATRASLSGVPADKLRALDDALTKLALSRASADVRRLYDAVATLHTG